MKLINLRGVKYKFLITGGTGLIGSKLCEELLKDDQEITVLTRKKSFSSSQKIDFISNLDDKDFDYDIVINLCGEPISQRWTKDKKREIYNSRINITEELANKIHNNSKPVKLFISGSAIGYYGTSLTTIFQEKSISAKQNLFSQTLCSDWEAAAKKVGDKTRLVLLRTSVVIAKNGGMLKKLFLPFFLGLGGKISDGKQMLSWIFIDDAISAIAHIINKDSISGAVNLVSPNCVSNEEFSRTFAKTLNRPCLFTIPALTMKLAYGQMAQELLLEGQKVYPRVLLDSGFEFKFEHIEQALQASFKK